MYVCMYEHMYVYVHTYPSFMGLEVQFRLLVWDLKFQLFYIASQEASRMLPEGFEGVLHRRRVSPEVSGFIASRPGIAIEDHAQPPVPYRGQSNVAQDPAGPSPCQGHAINPKPIRNLDT